MTATPSAGYSDGMTDYDVLIAKLDLPAKVRLLTGASAFTLAPEPEIGLAELRMSDGPTGVRGLKFSGGRTVALLPNATLLASSWSDEVMREVGEILAEEALAQQIHVVLGPTINLHRSPLGGRLFEAYSEDPLLTGKLAAAYVRGLQALAVGACLKHLVGNESETERNTVNSVIDEATLRELYLLPFEIAVAESDPWSIMAAYNDVNGVAATEQDHVVNEVVKGEWGWDGLVVSDWYATKTAGPAANGGLDLVMPGPDGPWGAALVEAVRSGEVPEAVVDEHLRRLLRLADRVGVLSNHTGTERSYPTDLPAPDSDVRREQLTRLAAQGMTVVRNESDALPLARGTKVALIGRHAVDTIGMGGGSAQVNPPYQVSVADGLRELIGDDVTVTDGVEVRTRPTPARPGTVSDPQTGRPGVRFLLRAADGRVLEERVAPNASTAVGFDDDLSERVVSVSFRARLAIDGDVEVGTSGVGRWQLQVGNATFEDELAVAGTGFGEEMIAPPFSTRVVRVSAGALIEGAVVLAEPSADKPMAGAGLFSVIARQAPRPPSEIIAEAVASARDADVAVVVVGVTEEQETEAVDKSTLALPGEQDALVRAVAAGAHRTVVVVNSATPVLMPWLDAVDAVLVAGLPGQEAGRAVAAALLGDVEPAGRLVTTWPAADGDSPAWSVTPVDGQLEYTEGPFIGYRGHYAGRAPQPLFWFGHGLGYGCPEWTDHDVSDPGVTLVVRNPCPRATREVVQVYVRPYDETQPVRLAGWTAVTVPPGEEVPVTVALDPRALRRWDTESNAWAPLGPGTLLVARGLGDIRAELPLS
jgi:beta-glucosidase